METAFVFTNTGWFVAICVALFLFLVLMLLLTYGQRYPMTKWERMRPMLGDDYFKPEEKPIIMEQAVTINAPADLVWRYVKQTDQQKAGWYSFDWIERLFTFDIENCYLLKPSWQKLEKGDYMWMHQPKFPFVMGNWAQEVDEENHRVWFVSDTRKHPTDIHAAGAMKLIFKQLAWAYSWEVAPLDEYHCRLRTRLRVYWEPRYLTAIFMGAFFVADTYMFSGLCSRMRRLCNGTLYISNKYLSNKFVLPEEQIDGCGPKEN